MSKPTSKRSRDGNTAPGMFPRNESDVYLQQSYYYETLCNDLRITKIFIADAQAKHRAILAKLSKSTDNGPIYVELAAQREIIVKYERKAKETEELIALTKNSEFKVGKVRWDKNDGWMLELGGLKADVGEVPLRSIASYLEKYEGYKD